MTSSISTPDGLDPGTQAFYRKALRALTEARLPFLVGGAYAFGRYTRIARHTKDFDIFVRRRERDRILEALAAIGCRTELTFPHWLAKAYSGEDFIDVIYGSGNGLSSVDDDWFEHAVEGEVLGVSVKLCPAEEMIWQKAFVMERERYDGSDVAHLLSARGAEMDWPRLRRRFGRHWRVLLSHLVLFGFIYPGERSKIPSELMQELLDLLQRETSAPPARGRICQGTFLSRVQYLVDIERWGYEDGRLQGDVKMTREDIAHWTKAIPERVRPQ